MKYDHATITLAFFMLSLGGMVFVMGLAIMLSQIALKP